MPTKSTTATKRAAKKKSTKRATTASADKPTKKTSARAKKAARKVSKSGSTSVSDDDFGSGLMEEEAPAKKPAKKTAKKKTAARKKKTDDIVDDVVEKKPVKKKRKAAKKKKPAAPADDFAADLEIESTADASAKSEKPKKKRVARKKKPLEAVSSDDFLSDDFGGDVAELEPKSDKSSKSTSSKVSDDDISFDSESNNSKPSRNGDTKSEDGEGRRGGRRRRGRRGRGRRGGGGGGGNDRKQQRGGRDRGPARDIEPISSHVTGVLEMHPKGYGFVRDTENDYAAQDTDPFVSTQFIDRYRLREGVLISGEVGPGHRGQGPRLTSIETVEGKEPETFAEVKDFDKLTPINPEEHIKLEMGPSPITMRVVDLLCPIGKGQRALIVAPPRSGKTILLQQIADSVAFNHPECHLMVMLIDERPEEVTEMRRHVKGEVIASSIDRDLENHVRISQLVIERAKRLAEQGKDVFILLDSITRLARAFNKYTNTGRTGSGGIDVRAMDKPKKIFGSARVFDEGGSITVVGTALVQTGSRMDDVIFEEFKGTGNMELVLSRELADRRIWPAMDIERSGTRREEKLLAPETLEGVTMMRRSLISLHSAEAMEQLVRTLAKFDTNTEFLSRIRSVM